MTFLLTAYEIFRYRADAPPLREPGFAIFNSERPDRPIIFDTHKRTLHAAVQELNHPLWHPDP